MITGIEGDCPSTTVAGFALHALGSGIHYPLSYLLSQNCIRNLGLCSATHTQSQPCLPPSLNNVLVVFVVNPDKTSPVCTRKPHYSVFNVGTNTTNCIQNRPHVPLNSIARLLFRVQRPNPTLRGSTFEPWLFFGWFNSHLPKL